MPQSSSPPDVSFEGFCAELSRLVEQFERNIGQYRSNNYDEASLRQEFLNPLFRALGWDIENKAGLIPQHREVEIESRTQIAGRSGQIIFSALTGRTASFAKLRNLLRSFIRATHFRRNDTPGIRALY